MQTLCSSLLLLALSYYAAFNWQSVISSYNMKHKQIAYDWTHEWGLSVSEASVWDSVKTPGLTSANPQVSKGPVRPHCKTFFNAFGLSWVKNTWLKIHKYSKFRQKINLNTSIVCIWITIFERSSWFLFPDNLQKTWHVNRNIVCFWMKKCFIAFVLTLGRTLDYWNEVLLIFIFVLKCKNNFIFCRQNEW